MMRRANVVVEIPPGEEIASTLRRLKKTMGMTGTAGAIRRHEFFERAPVRRKRKALKSRRRARQLAHRRALAEARQFREQEAVV